MSGATPDDLRRTRLRARYLDGALLLGLYLLLGVETVLPISPWEAGSGFVLITAAMLTVRRAPLVALIIASTSSGALLFDFGERIPAWPFLLMAVVGYFSGRRLAHARPALISFGAVFAVGLLASAAISDNGAADWAAMAMTLVFAAMFPWQFGRYQRMRDELVRTGWERAEQLEHEQRIVSEQARLRERTRIAGDMHDSLGHELSLIALRAGALELDSELTERHRLAAGQLRESAGVATERLREIIGVLREDTEAPPIEPVDDTVDALVQRARGSGMRVRLDGSEGQEGTGSVPLMVRRAAYRIVQEALTNASKHAPGAQVTVELTHSAQRTLLRVTNEAPPQPPDPGVSKGNRGLAGLRERVRLTGGTLRAGPLGDGFEVAARLPHAAAPGSDSAATEAERSESARQLETARRRVRNSLISVFAMPIVLFFALLAVSGVIYTIDWFTATWHDQDGFRNLRVGSPYSQVEKVLPARQQERDARVPEPPVPAGVRCEYYGATQNMFDGSDNYYRVCFSAGRLVSKNVLLDPRGDGR